MPTISREWESRTGWLRPSHREIQGAVSEVFKISRVDMLSARRTPAAVVARHAAMAICKRMTLMSLPQIGRKFGGRDHTTVLHAVRKFQPLMDICDQTLTTTNPPHEWARMLYELVGSVPFGEGKNRRAPRV